MPLTPMALPSEPLTVLGTGMNRRLGAARDSPGSALASRGRAAGGGWNASPVALMVFVLHQYFLLYSERLFLVRACFCSLALRERF
ncbi:hypothetical protein MARSALSMR5_04212 (plasmid) [Marinobacter salarius]|uniref:Uncharacterized protein n=1 Tax=Marinobacter salarius TaxID=1420917 RepID=A0A1W6KFX9_9GAMM|nr:hypothetical protein MARSALSMR5_04212 [Marinobacter salarius]